MDTKEILEIMDLFAERRLTKLTVKEGEFFLKLEKQAPVVSSVTRSDLSQEFLGSEDVSELKENGQANEVLPEEEEGFLVKSPLVGIYYEAASPESDPFVAVGDHVTKGQTVCIIEAMKMINEIKAPVAGVVQAINFKNQDLVQYDDAIMEIKEDV